MTTEQSEPIPDARLKTHGELEFEVATRELVGPLVPGRPPIKALPFLVTTPAVLLLVIFLVAPVGWTSVEIIRSPDSGSVFDGDAVGAYLRTGVGVLVVGGGVIGGGLLLAQASVRRWRRIWPALLTFLVMPFGVSALLAGAAFRMLFDPVAERGTLTGLAESLGLDPNWLGSGWLWVVLVSAFAWMWLGFAGSLFRAGLDALDRDPVQKERVKEAKEKEGYWAGTREQWSTIRPVFFIVTMTIVVAAARLFDLILIAAPGSMQYDADTVGVRWWRLTTAWPDRGGPAVFVLPLTIFLIALALFLAWRVERKPLWVSVRTMEPSTPVVPAGPLRWRFAGLALGAILAVPLLVLLATAFHPPEDAGAVPWWEIPFGSDLALESFRQVATAGLWRSVGVTAFVAVTATMVVIGATVPVAYVLAERSASPKKSTGKWASVIMAALAVLAVMPVQMYALALRDATSALGLGGSRIPLIFVHAAAGLPFAILVLTTAIASAPPVRAKDAMAGLIAPGKAARRLWTQAGKAVVAVAVLEFVLVWNDFIISFLIGGPGTSPLTLVLWGEARQFSVASGTVAASAVVSAIVPITLLLATWRRFVVPGLTGGVLR